MDIIPEAMLGMSKLLYGCESVGFEASGDAGEYSILFPVEISYWYDIPSGKDMSYVKQVLALPKPCVRFIATAYGSWNLRHMECRIKERNEASNKLTTFIEEADNEGRNKE